MGWNRSVRAAILVVLGMGISGGASGAGAAMFPLPTGAAQGVSEPGGEASLLFGAYASPAPAAGMDAVVELERAIGRRVDVVHWYQHWAGWGVRFEPGWAGNVNGSGRIPLLTWEPWAPGSPDQPDFRLSRIVAGAFDPYIERWAKALKAYGRRLYLRPMHEMNSWWYPWAGTRNGNSALSYVRAWRHMHRIFDRVGATNVRWVWSPLAEDMPATPVNGFERYYPGSRWVDVLALDGYNWGTSVDGYGGWRSFVELFGPAYERITRLGPQPVWIAETASDSVGGDKAAWIREMFTSLPSFPRIRAVAWFNALKERDWRATSSPEVAAAFNVEPGKRRPA